jgi:hypothetical protein
MNRPKISKKSNDTQQSYVNEQRYYCKVTGKTSKKKAKKGERESRFFFKIFLENTNDSHYLSFKKKKSRGSLLLFFFLEKHAKTRPL